MKRRKYNLGHYRLLTGDMGVLIPIGLTEVLPGDTFQHSTSALVRLSPMVAPVMHPIDVRIHHFYVPNRLIAPGISHNWEDFITGGEDNTYNTPIPTQTIESILNVAGQDLEDLPGSLLDYYGVDYRNPNIGINVYPFVGYKRIFDEFYRDQDLEDENTNNLTVSPDRISWGKDYFTTARPWPYKGPAVTIPVFSDGTGASPGVQFGDFTLDDLRTASAMQRFAENRARYGSRYTEYLRFLGIRPSDARMDRPEYLGGGRATVNVSEVLQTAPETGASSETDTEYGVGDLYGHGIAGLRTRPYRRFFEEHGFVHTLLSVRPHALYMTGMDRHWLKKDREDFFQREFSNVGDQEVWMGELWNGSAGDPYETFGYQERYAEYRGQYSRVAGEFRDIMNYWHMGRDFSQKPVLNANFIKCNPTKRPFAVNSHHVLWVMVNHHLMARRQVPMSRPSTTI